MPLTNGSRLGPYEILAGIGTGGMGEVYKARDTRLNRTVAIKVLPELLALDPEFRERFEREARTISQITHPHICTLYDVGHQDPSTSSGRAVDYLVMEFLDGQSLADRLNKGRVPVREALSIAIWVLARSPRPPTPQVARFAIVTPPAQPITIALADRDIAISPDGTHIVYRTGLTGPPQLMVRDLDQQEARALPGVLGARGPFFSSDSHWIGFFSSANELKKVSPISRMSRA